MRYVTGVHALNLPCSLNTCGDWHCSAIQWTQPTVKESEGSLYEEYGIESGKKIPEHEGLFCAANHIRALLDLLEAGKLALAQGMNKDFICNDEYTEEIFLQVLKLKNLPHWGQIDKFMGKEYMTSWLDFKVEEGLL